MEFADLRLAEPILRALVTEGYVTATPVQEKAIPLVLEGRDVLGSAQTGTGKTAAFALPILHRLAASDNAEQREIPGAFGRRKARCLALCPTRELATQIADGFHAYGRNLKLRHTTIFGGVNQRRQVDALRHGLDIIVATPGRLMDLMEQGHVDLSAIEMLVLDEADRMLDMGFIHDIRRITAKVPGNRQTLLFSATMPPEIRRLADSLMKKPAVVQIAAAAATTAQIDESVYFVEKAEKGTLLAHLFASLPIARGVVFMRTKHGADKVVRQLHTKGIHAEAIHGNKSQNVRQRALHNFKVGKTPLLIATDIAARGIDVDGVTHVINYDLTHEPETYVHRIGRTGRAGATGHAISFCDREERSNLRAIEALVKRKIAVKTSDAAPAGSGANDDADRPATPAASPRHGGPSGRSPDGHSFSNDRAPHRRDGHAPRQSRHEGGPTHRPAGGTPPRHDHRPAAPRQHAAPGRGASGPGGGRHPLAHGHRRPTGKPAGANRR